MSTTEMLFCVSLGACGALALIGVWYAAAFAWSKWHDLKRQQDLDAKPLIEKWRCAVCSRWYRIDQTPKAVLPDGTQVCATCEASAARAIEGFKREAAKDPESAKLHIPGWPFKDEECKYPGIQPPEPWPAPGRYGGLDREATFKPDVRRCSVCGAAFWPEYEASRLCADCHPERRLFASNLPGGPAPLSPTIQVDGSLDVEFVGGTFVWQCSRCDREFEAGANNEMHVEGKPVCRYCRGVADYRDQMEQERRARKEFTGWNKFKIEVTATTPEQNEKATRLFHEFRKLLVANGLTPELVQVPTQGHRNSSAHGRGAL